MPFMNRLIAKAGAILKDEIIIRVKYLFKYNCEEQHNDALFFMRHEILLKNATNKNVSDLAISII
ncbi:hypothetical protein GCM10023261_16110 [Bartonella jaculi]|uniref:Uncharacterized protein n=1 Tax=Bartonella jaculi TaxID=686226 RepID=A0ABP9N884_9HYPH